MDQAGWASHATRRDANGHPAAQLEKIKAPEVKHEKVKTEYEPKIDLSSIPMATPSSVRGSINESKPSKRARRRQTRRTRNPHSITVSGDTLKLSAHYAKHNHLLHVVATLWSVPDFSALVTAPLEVELFEKIRAVANFYIEPIEDYGFTKRHLRRALGNVSTHIPDQSFGFVMTADHIPLAEYLRRCLLGVKVHHSSPANKWPESSPEISHNPAPEEPSSTPGIRGSDAD